MNRLALAGLVAVGGAVGTLARYGLTVLFGPADGVPWATLCVNLVGSFALGMLLAALLRAGEETPTRRNLRLGLGTGFLGGLTTFSSLAMETEQLIAVGNVGLGAGYALGSIVLGVTAAIAGMTLAGRKGSTP